MHRRTKCSFLYDGGGNERGLYRVFPLMYSFGCCKSFRIPLLLSSVSARTSNWAYRHCFSPDEYHLLLQLPLSVVLRADLVVEVQ